ncbi:MAG: hypothetical protein J7L37_05935 [Thermococcus sp.]|nr:hypothetical protein [Thermococcus sp.]
MLRSRRRAQTALEVLFILAIILAGVVVITSSYTKSSTVTTMDVYVRDAASSACDYLNEGVVILDDLHEPLNGVFVYTNYSYAFLSFERLKTVEAGSEVSITVNISSVKVFPETERVFMESSIKEYILRYISSRPNVRRDGDYLYFGGKKFTIVVKVRGETG